MDDREKINFLEEKLIWIIGMHSETVILKNYYQQVDTNQFQEPRCTFFLVFHT